MRCARRSPPARGRSVRTPSPPRSRSGGGRCLKIKHVPEQLFDAVVNPIIFTLMFTYLLGGAIAGLDRGVPPVPHPRHPGPDRLLITAYTGVNLNTDISKGVADRFRSLPIWRPAVIVGALLGDAARYTLASAIVLALGLVLGFSPEGGVVGVLLSVLLLLVFAFSVSWIWTALGLVAADAEHPCSG